MFQQMKQVTMIMLNCRSLVLVKEKLSYNERHTDHDQKPIAPKETAVLSLTPFDYIFLKAVSSDFTFATNFLDKADTQQTGI